MSLPIRLNPAARLDYIQAVVWYESQAPGLENAFRNHLRKAFERIRMFPHAGSIVREGYRSCRVLRYPYQVIYSVELDCIRVWSIFHTSQNPSILNERLKP